MPQRPDAFTIDWSRYRLVDLSYTVTPPGTDDRPFITEQGLLADDSFMHRVQTHTHVGTHVESPAHFFADAKTVVDFPLERFLGRAVLLSVPVAAECIPLTAAGCERLIGDLIQPGDIVLCRNGDLASRQEPIAAWPSLAGESARWLADHGVKLVGFDNYFRLGRDIPEVRLVHDVLLGQEICLIEFLDHLDDLTQPVFYFLALPFKAASDSSWARAVALEARR